MHKAKIGISNSVLMVSVRVVGLTSKVVAPASKWKEKGHEIEVLMAGCSPTPCSPNLHVESGADVEGHFLVTRWMMDRQSGKSEIS